MLNRRKKWYLGFVAIVGCLALAHNASALTRGIWVTRFDYKCAADVASIMENAHYLGVKQVYFQVRGNATVCYPSKIEPWAWELTGNSPQTIGVDPGWDPLATALAEAKKQGLELHAWMNVFPGWRGVEPAPAGTRQPWVTHRSWFMIDHRGELLRPTATFYSFLSPGSSPVRSYLSSVFGELARNYPNLDGIHLDYVRYPARNEVGNFRDFSYDEESVRAYQAKYKRKPNYDQPEWGEFKCEQVNASILAIRKAIRAVSPSIRLSATCSDHINEATSEKGQDPASWLKNGLVDFVVAMAYQRSTGDLVSRLEKWNRAFDGQWMDRMIVGLNVDFNNEKEVVRQMQFLQGQNYEGSALFAYSSLFTKGKPNGKAEAVRVMWHEEILKEILTRSGARQSQ